MTRLGPGRRPGSPFRVLGLPASRDLSDDDVRAAWRRIATATHPDRLDGGDPERFALASAAYTALRTRYARGEALADLAGHRVTTAAPGPGPAPPAAAPAATAAAGRAHSARPEPFTVPDGSEAPDLSTSPDLSAAPDTAARAATSRPAYAAANRLLWRVRHGRPGVLAIRAAIAAAAGAVPVALIGFAPSALALIAGAVTWFALTVRSDLAPPGPG